MEILSVSLMYISGVWGAIYLIMNGHPWFGLFVLISTVSIKYSSFRSNDAQGTSDTKDEPHPWVKHSQDTSTY